MKDEEGRHGNHSRRQGQTGCQGDKGEVKGGSGQPVETRPCSFISLWKHSVSGLKLTKLAIQTER